MRATSLMMALVAAGLALVGCSSSSSPANPDSFVGSWAFQAGTITTTCLPLPIGNIDLTGDAVTITKIDSSHIAMSIAGGGLMCDVKFSISGDTATTEANQTCAVSASGQMGLLTVSTWTLSLSGSSINMSMTGTATAAQGLETCSSITSTGTMVRSGSDAAQSG